MALVAAAESAEGEVLSSVSVDAVRRVLEAHFPRCPGTDVVQGDARTPGRCGCPGEQHAYLLPELGALLFCFNPDVYSQVCGSIGNPSYDLLGRCVQAIEGTPLTLGLRAVNKSRVRNAVFGRRRGPPLPLATPACEPVHGTSISAELVVGSESTAEAQQLMAAARIQAAARGRRDRHAVGRRRSERAAAHAHAAARPEPVVASPTRPTDEKPRQSSRRVVSSSPPHCALSARPVRTADLDAFARREGGRCDGLGAFAAAARKAAERERCGQQLERRGFFIAKGARQLSESIKATIRASKEWEDVFNGKSGKGELTRDGSRQQTRSNADWDPAVRPLLESDLRDLGALRCTNGQEKSLNQLVALKSYRRRSKAKKHQPRHADSAERNSLRDQAPDAVPLAALLAIQGRTRLHVWPFDSEDEEVIHLDEGDLLIFRGDLGHAGAEYDDEDLVDGVHLRLHVYIDSPVIERAKDEDGTALTFPF